MSKINYRDLISSNPSLFKKEKVPIKLILDEDQISLWQEKKRAECIEQGKPLEWADIGVVLDDPYILVIRDLVEFPDGHLGSYFRIINRADLRGGQGVVVLAEMNGKYLLIHIYRHPTRSWSYEVPRGFGEQGIQAKEQAKNEIREEVGGEISELIDLGIYHSNTGLEGNQVKLFYAKLSTVGKPANDEGIESLVWVSLTELEDLIASGEITDGFTIAAYARAKLKGLI